MVTNPPSIQDEERLRALIEKAALYNAYTHGGRAQVQAVVRRILAEEPQYRSRHKEVSDIAIVIVEAVNKLTPVEQRRMLEERWPESLTERERRPEERPLPPLPNAGRYSVIVTRFSPNPDCVLHMGSARAIVLSYEYAEEYKGKFYLRFEDTDPRLKRPKLEFYEGIREDLRWLGCRWSGEFIQSQRLEIYYDYVKKLLEMEKAYVCVCEPQKFHRLVVAGRACPCRILSGGENLERWDKMLKGEYAEGKAVVRVKTDLQHPNPAVRDWPAMRIIDTRKTPHPITADSFRVWPLYNLSCGLDDHLLEVTHIIRGKEHLTNEVRQRFLYEHFGWEYPETIHYGRLKITGASLSKSEIKRGVESGAYSGYDDPRLATFAALRRRGIQPDAIRRMILEIGVKPVDITLSWETLYTYNRRIIDPSAPRYFFVENPTPLRVKGIGRPYSVGLHLHPDHPEWGFREFQLHPEGEILTLNIAGNDMGLLKRKTVVRLMGLFNVEVTDLKEGAVEAVYHSESYEEAKKLGAPLIHFLPSGTGIETEVVMPDATIRRGLAEEACRELRVGQVLQFERFGFVRVDKLNGKITVYFTHK
ncbi:MAG: glutamate--tRNA ligase [Candidatus Bathyarchaeia archaeon]